MEWALDVQGDGIFSIKKMDIAFRNSMFFGAKEGRSGFEEFLRAEIKDAPKERSLLFIFRHIMEYFDAVTADLASGRSYNIDPNVVRQSEDIAGEPGIKSNGRGLAATLNSAKAAARSVEGYSHPYRFVFWYQFPRYKKELLSDLVSYSRLVNGDIDNIDVESDPNENKLRVFLMLSYDGSQLKLPLSLASDGTVKWLALVTAVLTNTSAVAVEEPENFLHPLMQREIVNIIRSSCAKSTLPTFAIITTHSETLINSVSPEELVIFSMSDGATSAVRPSNAEQLRREISSTGFGLGYYFLSGAVE